MAKLVHTNGLYSFLETPKLQVIKKLFLARILHFVVRVMLYCAITLEVYVEVGVHEMVTSLIHEFEEGPSNLRSDSELHYEYLQGLNKGACVGQ